MKNNSCKNQKIIDGLTYCGLTGGEACTNCICPNCYRIMPNKNHRRRHGCKYCVPEKNTKYCNGKY